ncbi:MAG: glycosyltransferase [Cyclobacteriaceae bacterium]
MKVFIIPSWYPSESNPIYGIFNKEQARMMARERPEWSVGVSKWGQGDETFLLMARDPRSLAKYFRKFDESEIQLADNLKEYFSGAFTWTQKIKKGNIDGIIRANDRNLQQFISDFGRPDVISAQASYPGAVVACALSEKYDIPFTVTIRMSPFPFPQYDAGRNQLKPILDLPLRKADMLICTSNDLKERVESYGFEKVRTINNPVDTDLFKPGKGEREEQITVLAVGRIEEQKGIDLLLEAMAQVPRIKLRIGGKGAYLNDYKRLSERLGVENCVEWLGELSREETVKEMQKCSFYVLSSRHETFGNVVVEAMSCGKPVVATKCGGPGELVTEETGYLCEIDAKDLAEKMKKMSESINSFDSVKIRQYIEKKYAPQIWIHNLEQIFKSVTPS